MEKFSVTIVFDHRRRTEKGKEGPLEVRITYARKPYYINTGVRVKENEWAGTITGQRQERDVLNERLAYIAKRVAEEVNKMQMTGETFDVKVVKDRVFCAEQKDERQKMIDWLAEQVPLLKIKKGTKRRYDTLINRLDEYKQLNEWKDLTIENIYKWDKWLHERKKQQSNGDRQAGKDAECIGDGAVYNYHRTLRALLNRAVKFGLIENNPYDKIRGEFRKGIKENVEYLTVEEMAAVESLRPIAGTQMAMARDLFVFQMYTGLSYNDAEAFDINDYKKIDGKWVNIGNRIKTGVAYVSMLYQEAVEVLERYGMETPKINNTQYNACLKTIQQALGIKTRMHSHLARHTFATRQLSLGAKIENVSKMLGHTNITQTQKYAKVLAKDVLRDMDMVAERMQKRKL